jgi:hypothetical protein
LPWPHRSRTPIGGRSGITRRWGDIERPGRLCWGGVCDLSDRRRGVMLWCVCATSASLLDLLR